MKADKRTSIYYQLGLSVVAVNSFLFSINYWQGSILSPVYLLILAFAIALAIYVGKRLAMKIHGMRFKAILHAIGLLIFTVSFGGSTLGSNLNFREGNEHTLRAFFFKHEADLNKFIDIGMESRHNMSDADDKKMKQIIDSIPSIEGWMFNNRGSAEFFVYSRKSGSFNRDDRGVAYMWRGPKNVVKSLDDPRVWTDVEETKYVHVKDHWYLFRRITVD